MDWIEIYKRYGMKGLAKELARVVLCAGLAIVLIAVVAVALVEVPEILWR